MASACPVPTATTWTVMSVAAVKIGRMWPNNPESWVEVVELSVMNRSSACAEPAARTATSKATQRIMLTTSRPAHPGDSPSKPISANQPWFTIISLLHVYFIVADDLAPARDLAVQQRARRPGRTLRPRRPRPPRSLQVPDRTLHFA